MLLFLDYLHQHLLSLLSVTYQKYRNQLQVPLIGPGPKSWSESVRLLHQLRLLQALVQAQERTSTDLARRR
jgi:hypothetical protein